MLTPMAIALVVLAEIFLLGGLDLGNSSYFSLSDTFHGYRFADVHTCENWLEKQDNVAYSRDFRTDPVLVSTSDKEACSIFNLTSYHVFVKCFYSFSDNTSMDFELFIHEMCFI